MTRNETTETQMNESTNAVVTAVTRNYLDRGGIRRPEHHRAIPVPAGETGFDLLTIVTDSGEVVKQTARATDAGLVNVGERVIVRQTAGFGRKRRVVVVIAREDAGA